MTNRPIFILFGLTGFCALVYQLIWARWLGLLLGNFATSTATILTVFMGGLAIGSVLIGRLVVRCHPNSALRMYAFLEGTLVVYVAISPMIFSSSSMMYQELSAISARPVIRASLCAIFLLPPTILMGGTLPVLVRALSATGPAALGPLYAVNTWGGAVGVLVAAFILLPSLGLKLTLWAACLLNSVVAITAYVWSRRWPEVVIDPSESTAPEPSRMNSSPVRLVLAMAAFFGFLSLGFEVALTRLTIITITGSSVYGLALMLSAYLTGLAIGAALLKFKPPPDVQHTYVAVAVASGLVWLFSLSTPFWDLLPPFLVKFWWNPFPFNVIALVNYLVVIVLTLMATAAFGYLLPALATLLKTPSANSIGQLFAANTAGAMLGALVASFVLLPHLGLHATLLLLGTLALFSCALASIRAFPFHWTKIVIALPPLVVLPLIIPSPNSSVMNAGMYNRPLSFKPTGAARDLTPTQIARRFGEIVYQKDSLTGRVAVLKGLQGYLVYVVNGKPDGSSSLSDMYTQLGSVHLAAVLHPNPKQALIIGLGTGTSAGALLLHPEVDAVTVVEYEPAQVDVARIFRGHNRNVLDHPKFTLSLDDARHYLLTDQKIYDLVISEPSNIFVSGMVNLYTRDFYEIVKRHLKRDGIFLQWIHYYQASSDNIKGHIRTFQSVFPHSTLWLHKYGDAFLVGANSKLIVDLTRWEQRLGNPRIAADLVRIGIAPPIDLTGWFLWSAREMKSFAGNARICTDDDPYLEFDSPRIKHSLDLGLRLFTEMMTYGSTEPLTLAHEDYQNRVRLGLIFIGQQKLMRAYAEFHHATKLDRSRAEPQVQMARVLLLLARTAEARKTLAVVLKRFPENIRARSMLKDLEARKEQTTTWPR